MAECRFRHIFFALRLTKSHHSDLTDCGKMSNFTMILRVQNTNLNPIAMKHRILTPALLTATLPAAGLFASCQEADSTPQKPNIIYILADDLGRAELGCYGQEKIETPNIDRLAREGMLFTNHYSGQAVSGPSRCALFTGLHMGHAYIRGNDEGNERGEVWNYKKVVADSTLEGQRPLPDNTVTIPRKMKEAGYTTACVGKWGLGYPNSESTPNKMGFDFFYGYNCQRQAHTYYPPFLYRNEHREYLDNKVLIPGTRLDKGADPYDEKSYAQFTDKEYAPDLMFRELMGFVDRAKEQPFVLFWTTPVPHVPLQAPRKWVDYYRQKLGDEEPYTGNKGYFPCRYPRATYAAMVSYWDEQIGQLVQKLKDEGIYDNTLIIFTSDNGPSFNGGTASPYFDSAKPFKSEHGWGKCFLREGGIRAPMIACWPDRIKAGSRSDLLSAFWDMMPTMCEIAGVEAPRTDGISMLPTFLGQPQQEHEFLMWEFTEVDGEKAVRMGKWKGFVNNIKKGNRHLELYDLEVDPREQHDVSEQHPEIVERMLEILRTEHSTPELKQFDMPVW